jgi:hypothetical protein
MSLMLRILFAMGVFCIASVAEARTLVAPLARLGGAWLGTSESQGEYFRVEIDNSGKGVLTVFSLAGSSGPARAYEILSTTLSGYSISLELRPIVQGEPVFASGSADEIGLRLEVSGMNGTWTEKVILEPESEVLARINAVTRRAQEFKSRAQSKP